jgi:prolyl oligopeptidase
MKRLHLALVILGLCARLSIADGPPVAEVIPVTDDLFGTKVVDPYRYFENLDDPRVKAWFKGQGDYSRAILDGLSGRAAMRAEMEKYVNGAPAVVSGIYRLPGDLLFYQRLAAGENLGKLYMRQGMTGAETLLVDSNKLIGPHGEPPAINFYKPSPDGRYLAYGVSVGGSEMATLRVVDTRTGKDLPETIDRERFGGVTWRPDNESFFYNRLQETNANSSPLEYEEKSKVYLHVIGTPVAQDQPVLGFGLSAKVPLLPTDLPFVDVPPGSKYMLAQIEHGVEVDATFYAVPIADATGPQTPWVKICDASAGVTDASIHGDDIYLLTHNDAPRYKLIRTSIAQPDLAHAETIIPQQSGVLRSVHPAADAMYVQELDGAVDHILRVTYSGEIKQLTMPFEGGHSVESWDRRVPGVLLALNAWTKGSRVAAYDPATDQVTPTDLQPAGPYDNLDDITSTELMVPSYDGVEIPLSIISKKGIPLDGSNPTAVFAYGGYGITYDSGFSPTNLAWIEHGGIYAVAHVRGGGEFGEPWHLAAQKLTKPNVWRDLIACCKYLIAKKFTSPSHLAITGGSNGGITIGRAVTERPDLFAAAFVRAGCMNALRLEFSPNGPPNVPEFGSVATQEGFEDLYATDAYQHVKDGVRYPAILEYTGANDPRVSPWSPGKMTARLQAAAPAGARPILLTVDYQGGHGVGMSKNQRIDMNADMFSFFLWQMNDPAFLQHAAFHPDIEYENIAGESIKLDAAVPEGDGPFPIAILVHGGGWSSGDKQREFPVMFQALSAAKFTWFSIDYRLGPTHKWPACYEDMKAAIRWVKAHAAHYKGDPKRIALIGYSAGGELTTLAATQVGDDLQVAAVVGFSPPTDMVADTARRNGLSTSLKSLFGITTVDDHATALLHEMSPIDFVHPGLPPFLFIQGDADKSVMYPQTQAFAAKLKSVGVSEEFITVPGGPHDILQWEALLPDYREQVVDWLLRNDGVTR